MTDIQNIVHKRFVRRYRDEVTPRTYTDQDLEVILQQFVEEDGFTCKMCGKDHGDYTYCNQSRTDQLRAQKEILEEICIFWNKVLFGAEGETEEVEA